MDRETYLQLDRIEEKLDLLINELIGEPEEKERIETEDDDRERPEMTEEQKEREIKNNVRDERDFVKRIAQGGQEYDE